MIPSAKIDNRDNAPPENMLNMPRIVLCWLSNRRANSSGFRPGTVINVPARNTNIAPITKKIRFRNSLSFVTPPNPPGKLAAALANLFLYLAAGCFNCSARTLGNANAPDRHSLAHIA